MRLRWSRGFGYLGLAVAAACAAVLFILVLTSTFDTGKGLWTATFLAVVGVIASGSALFAEEGGPAGARDRSAWLKPRAIGFVFIAIFFGFEAMAAALALFEPRPAVETAPHAIENKVDRILTHVPPDAPPPSPPRILSRIEGEWGEPGCAVTYRFRIVDRSLTVDSLLRPPHAPPYHLVATVTQVRGDVLDVVGEEPATARGKAARFTYITNGAVQRLRWDDRVMPVPLDLDRCA